MGMGRIEWHPGFQAGMELRLRAHKAVLTFRHELPLTKQPTVLDTLIIEKAEGVSLEDDVAAMFLRHNIIEYKNPDDAMSIDAYYKLMAYMSLYKAETGLTDAIKADEVTGTLMRQRAPEGMFRELRRLGGRIERRFPGVYYIHGLVHMPTQVIAQSELEGPDNKVLRILTRAASTGDVRAFFDEAVTYTDQDDRNNADAVFLVSFPANRAVYDQAIRRESDMFGALKELVRDDFEQEIRQAEQKGVKIGEQRGEQKGFTRAIIDLVRDRILTPEVGAERMHITVDEMRRLAAID